MPTAQESRRALNLVADDATAASLALLSATVGDPVQRRLQLLDSVPELVGYYTDGTAALAADYYEEVRTQAGVQSPFVTDLVIADRVVPIRRGIAWASDPLFTGEDELTAARLVQVVQPEVVRPYRDTILSNRKRDPASVGWRRVTAGGCKFCRMLADRGAVYREDTARFAAHPGCHCSAEPVFGANDTGETASVMQYMASKSRRSPAQQQKLRDYLEANY